jgi:hypothetical protein
VGRLILLFILILAAARFFWKLVDVLLRGAMGPAAQTSRRGGAPAPVKMQPCPVGGTYVVPGKAISLIGTGAPVYFCSDKCRAEYQSR